MKQYDKKPLYEVIWRKEGVIDWHAVKNYARNLMVKYADDPCFLLWILTAPVMQWKLHEILDSATDKLKEGTQNISFDCHELGGSIFWILEPMLKVMEEKREQKPNSGRG